MKTLLALILMTTGISVVNGQYSLSDKTEQRINAIIARLKIEEKIELLGGTGFETKPIERLGIPSLTMTDGPVGVRWGESTAFPASIAMAATWNPELIEQVGRSLAREAKAKGRYMLLGPCVNINRVPQGGRNFESFGEDPFLAARMAVAYVKGVQSEKVVATTKHFAANNQEWERTTINARIDERTLHEIYFPAFKAAVQEAGAWSIMSAYNKLNGEWCSENSPLLNDILKAAWGFQGFVVSDWGAVHSTVPTASAGLDVEMPTGTYLNLDDVLTAIKKGDISESIIDDKVRRLLRVIMWTGLMDLPSKPDSSAVNSPEHQRITRETAQQGMVLLKNDRNLLPLELSKIKSIAVIGPSAAAARTGGGGSSAVYPVYSVSPLGGLRQKVGDAVEIRYALGVRMEGDIVPVESSALRPGTGVESEFGLKGEYFNNMLCSGTPVVTRIDKQVNFDWADGSPAPDVNADKFSVRWTGKLVVPATARYELSVRSDDGIRFHLDGKLVIDNWGDHAAETKSIAKDLHAGDTHDVMIEFYENGGAAVAQFGWTVNDDRELAGAVNAAKMSDVALVFVGNTSNVESEGFDRSSLELPEGQSELIRAVAKANKKTVVVLTSGAPVLMGSWIKSAPAILQTWFAGNETGNAVADILLGNCNPSGKLPVTFLKRWEDSPAYPTYPGKDGTTDYTEGIFVGYRHFDKMRIAPEFPFGHGLSYTTFEYRNLQVVTEKDSVSNIVRLSFVITNTGEREGAEVAQIYIHDVKASVPRPPKELKAFKRVHLAPGETQEVRVTLEDGAFAFYDVARHNWVVEPGAFELQVGSSSRRIHLIRTIMIQ